MSNESSSFDSAVAAMPPPLVRSLSAPTSRSPRKSSSSKRDQTGARAAQRKPFDENDSDKWLRALEVSGGDRSRLVQLLEIPYQALSPKLKKWMKFWKKNGTTLPANVRRRRKQRGGCDRTMGLYSLNLLCFLVQWPHGYTFPSASSLASLPPSSPASAPPMLLAPAAPSPVRTVKSVTDAMRVTISTREIASDDLSAVDANRWTAMKEELGSAATPMQRQAAIDNLATLTEIRLALPSTTAFIKHRSSDTVPFSPSVMPPLCRVSSVMSIDESDLGVEGASACSIDGCDSQTESEAAIDTTEPNSETTTPHTTTPRRHALIDDAAASMETDHDFVGTRPHA